MAVNHWVAGSNPARGATLFFFLSPLRLAVRTSPSHGGNTGSIPVGDTILRWLF